ncbi:MAG: RNA-binding protein, partial [Candidatus Gracilibacteria bacterium]
RFYLSNRVSSCAPRKLCKEGSKSEGDLQAIIYQVYMAKKLYVGNLSYNTTEDGLRAAFEQCGAVETATLITDRASGRSKGFGFVEMTSDEEAAAAIEKWNGQELDGRKIVVNEARPMGERPPRRGGFNRGGGGGGFRGGDRNEGNSW